TCFQERQNSLNHPRSKHCIGEHLPLTIRRRREIPSAILRQLGTILSFDIFDEPEEVSRKPVVATLPFGIMPDGGSNTLISIGPLLDSFGCPHNQIQLVSLGNFSCRESHSDIALQEAIKRYSRTALLLLPTLW